MKISELMHFLDELKTEYGDVDVYHSLYEYDDDGKLFEVEVDYIEGKDNATKAWVVIS